jgi:hypothetical protein
MAPLTVGLVQRCTCAAVIQKQRATRLIGLYFDELSVAACAAAFAGEGLAVYCFKTPI